MSDLTPKTVMNVSLSEEESSSVKSRKLNEDHKLDDMEIHTNRKNTNNNVIQSVSYALLGVSDRKNSPEYSNTFKRHLKKIKARRRSTSLLSSFHADLLSTKKNENLVWSQIEPILTEAKETLKRRWDINVEEFVFCLKAPYTKVKLSQKSDAILIMESWNKVLAFKSKFAEALVSRWRVLLAADEIEEKFEDEKTNFEQYFWVKNIMSSSSSSSTSHEYTTDRYIEMEALRMIESNSDPFYSYFGKRTPDLGMILISMLDTAVRDLCPHTQTVQREAYRKIEGSKDLNTEISDLFFVEDDCVYFSDYCDLLCSYSVKPKHWFLFVDAFKWAMENQNPYSLEDEKDDITKHDEKQSIHAKFVSGMIVLPMIEAYARRSVRIQETDFTDLKNYIQIQTKYYGAESTIMEVLKDSFANFFLTDSEAEDHFSDLDIEEISFYLLEVFLKMIENPNDSSDPLSYVRCTCNKISQKWNDLSLSTDSFLKLEKEILREVPTKLLECNPSFTEPFSYIWRDLLRVGILCPITVHQGLKKEAEHFYNEVAAELHWSHEKKEKRLFRVKTEITATGSYTHSSEELEIGAKLAWRNSAKCVGRIAWDTLLVRDCRNCSNNHSKVFHEVVEHLKIATGGSNIQSVMTVFRPQQRDKVFGMRFWNSQFVQYAGYVDKNNHTTVLGDPANVAITKYLIDRDLWIPPKKRSAFDVLPLVLKVPHNEKPYVFDLPREVVHEVEIEHPSYPELKNLGLKWAAVPAISNFMMTLGGIKYPCSPFNGWFVSIEVVRNLLERYDLSKPLATIFGIHHDDKLLKQKVSTELESAVLYSFEKKKFTMNDPLTVGESFLTHCVRERKLGRECPAQWSWIGGLLGPTNPTWHLEMRDFKKNYSPQYDYCCDPFLVTNLDGVESRKMKKSHYQSSSHLIKKRVTNVHIPKVLITYGSETGTAEEAAHSLAKRLKLCNPHTCPLNNLISPSSSSISKDTLSSFEYMIVICSTFGNGEPPKNASRFFEKAHELDFLKGMKFAVLALGSSLYPLFCKAGEDLWHKLNDAGGVSFFDTGVTKVDSAKGHQGVIIQWSQRVTKAILPEKLINQIKLANKDTVANNDTSMEYCIKWVKDDENVKEEKKGDSSRMPQCTKNVELCRHSHNIAKDNTQKSVRHIEIQMEDGISYESGDHLSISPVNSLEQVARFCECFGTEIRNAATELGYLDTHQSRTSLLEHRFFIECKENGKTSNVYQSHKMANKSLKHILQKVVDFSFHTSTYIIDLMSFLVTKVGHNNFTEELCVRSGLTLDLENFRAISGPLVSNDLSLERSNELIRKFKDKYPTIIDFFESFKSLFCMPLKNGSNHQKKPLIGMAEVLVLMPHMSKRFYSISSSNVLSQNNISITVGVVKHETSEGLIKKGVCSNYLANLLEGDTLDATIVRSSFRYPSNPNFPIIMIAAGTGIAPFMAFIEERAAEFDTYTQYADWHFFYGCRSKEEFLYKEKIEKWDEDGVIKSYISYSRENHSQKEHVQDKIEQHAESIVELLLYRNTHIMICGSASMASSCRKKVIELLRKYAHMSKMSAEHLLSSMMCIEKRWQLDVWGSTN